MRHKLCRSFHPWCPGVKNRCLYMYVIIINCLVACAHRVALAVLRGARPLPLKVAPTQRSMTTDFHLQSRRDSDCQMSELTGGLSIFVQACVSVSWHGVGQDPLAERTWWRHQMETFSALLAICAENSPAPVNSPHKGQCRGALMFSLICVWINGWVNNREAGDLRRHRGHYDVIVMRHCNGTQRNTCEWAKILFCKIRHSRFRFIYCTQINICTYQEN